MYSSGVHTAAPKKAPAKPITFDLSIVVAVVNIVVVVVIIFVVASGIRWWNNA